MTTGAGSQLSAAVTPVATGGTALHETIAPGGTPASVGGVVSRTVTVCDCDVALPHASVAVQVRVSVYRSAQVPGVVVSENVTTGA